MSPPQPGDVIRYSYLWWREHEAGEESGRKYRPCVVVVAIGKANEQALRYSVVPVTHVSPGDRPAVELPAAVKAHLKLDGAPSWVICDEINLFEWPTVDVANVAGGGFSFGKLPAALLKRIQNTLIESGRSRSLKITERV